MASPFIPHITEEIYHAEINGAFRSEKDKGYFYRNEKSKSIHAMKWPSFGKESAVDDAKLALLIISEGRKMKTLKKIRFGADISLLEVKCPKNKHSLLKPFLEDIASVMRAKEISLKDNKEVRVSIRL